MIRFQCPQCGKPVEVEEGFAGRRGRCPDCRSVVDIPGASSCAGASEAAQPRRVGLESAVSPAGRGPRKLTIPESVAGVVLAPPEASQPAASEAGRALAIAGLILGFVPILSAAGIVLGGIACSRAKRSGTHRTKRLAVAATVLSILMTLASAVLLVAVLVSVVQEIAAGYRIAQCQSRLVALAMCLEQYAATNSGVYPPSFAQLSGLYGFPGGWRCPETNAPYGYVAGLTPNPMARTILLYEAEPSHGCRTWLYGRPSGRNVRRLDGTVDFLTEEQFQQEMAAQPAPGGTAAGTTARP